MLGGATVADDTIMKGFDDAAIGMINSIPYSVDLATPENKAFLEAMQKFYPGVPVGNYTAVYLCQRHDSRCGAEENRRQVG